MHDLNKGQVILKNLKPLAEDLRPQELQCLVGQEHLLKENHPLKLMLEGGKLASCILWGPPGCGKTTIARLLGRHPDIHFVPLSAIGAGVVELRKVFEQAKVWFDQGKQTLLFVDEIHRFNRAQQDAFLPYVEEGVIVLVGATTENPSFALNAALLSRAQVFQLQRLKHDDLLTLLKRAESEKSQTLPITEEGHELLVEFADGDARALLNLCEVLYQYETPEPFSNVQLTEVLQKRAALYDKGQEEHYNLISALHKSIRGSDPDAALYWFQRMRQGGEDLLYISRRLIRCAVEDIGLSDPQALPQAIAAQQAFQTLGSPEGDLAIAQCVVYLSTAPKSNALYTAFKASEISSKRSGSVPPPAHILNAPTKLMNDLGYGEGYVYDHDTPQAFSGQNYFPKDLGRQNYYAPVERGFEKEINKRLSYWGKLRALKKQA